VTSRKQPGGLRRWFPRLVLPLALVLALAGLVWLQPDWLPLPGREAEPYPTVARDLDDAERLEEAILLGAGEMGVPRRRIARKRADDGVPIYEVRCPDRLHPVTANRWLHRVFADAGVEVADCAERGDLERPRLLYRLRLGGEGGARARLVLYPPTGQPPLREAWPRVAVIIDDLGHNWGRVTRGLLDLDLPLTASILPGLRRSARVEREARRRGHAVFLHLPMEPEGYPSQDPGPRAVFADMGSDSVAALMDALAADFEVIDGLNNHMGSRACCVDSVVRAVLAWAARRDLVVVDSQTSPNSRIWALGEEMELPVLRADLFLDGEGEDEAQVMANLAAAAEVARRRGWAVTIGHPRKDTLAALRKMGPRLRDYGVRFVTITEMAASLREADPSPPPARP